jgi:hypothetical protein
LFASHADIRAADNKQFGFSPKDYREIPASSIWAELIKLTLGSSTSRNSPMSDAIDRQAILELRLMARLYKNRGNLAKAEELLELVEQMEIRLRRKNDQKALELQREA